MSVERSFEAWEEMQRHGQDLADRLAQGFSGLIHSHMNPNSFSWPNHQKLFDYDLSNHISANSKIPPIIGKNSPINGVSAFLDIGNRLGQAGADLGACFNGLVQQFFRQLPLPFRHDDGGDVDSVRTNMNFDAHKTRNDASFDPLRKDDFAFGLVGGQLSNLAYADSNSNSKVGSDDNFEDESFALNLKSTGHLGRSQGSINITSTYDSRTNDVVSSLNARGDLWRAEASHGGSSSGNESSPYFLIQLGPVLFVRDTTLLLPVHLSKQHLLWYGFDRKNGMHSLCPAIWSKHRRWLLMSMICLNPLACSFMDLQFPNGQFTYVSGEGLTTSAFLPVFGGLLQVQGQYPGEMRLSYSYKNKWGTRITPMVQWPDKSFSLGLAQALAWQRSGLMVHPTVQLSMCPTFGGSNPGVRTEIIHSVKEKLNLTFGCVCSAHPSAFASISVGRSKWNGNVGSSGVVVNVETPLSSVGRPSFSVQLNSGVEF